MFLAVLPMLVIELSRFWIQLTIFMSLLGAARALG
jgi:hypothetical protein